MDYNRQELKLVEQEIKDLLKKKTQLKELKEGENRLSNREEAELEGIGELLKELKEDKKNWQELIKLATKEDTTELESKSFRDADNEWTASVTGIDVTYREWSAYQLDDSINPSPIFQQVFEQVCQVFHMQNEASRRIILNIFLTDVLSRSEFNQSLRVFPEIRMEVSKIVGRKKRKIVGDADYTIGFGKGMDLFGKTPPTELHLVAIEAKKDWGEGDLWQCVAETATLFKSRKDAGKPKCSVWGVLSNAVIWQFLFIDEQGLLWRSEEISLSLRSYKEAQVLRVYRFLYYVVKCCFEVCTPNTTPASSSVDLHE
jgi:hypothetical protein